MIDPIIRQQLENCKVADVPRLQEDQYTYIIPQGAKVKISPYQVGKCYLVSLSDEMLHPSAESVIASNWNGGLIPKHRYYKCEINKVMGTMVKLVGCGYIPENDIDTFDLWDGWVPMCDLTIVRELD